LLPDTITDEFLVEKAKDGDEKAFLLLYERHRSAIFKFLYRLSGSAEVAEDIAHDSFVSLVRGSKGFQMGARAPLRIQLYSRARNLAMEYFRNSAKASDIVKDDASTRREKPVSQTQAERAASEVTKAVASLPTPEREVLIFFEYEGLRLDEIGTIVGTDVEAVTARLMRARQRLQNTLGTKL